VGGTVRTLLGSTLAPEEHERYTRKYCVEKDIFNALRRSIRGPNSGGVAPYEEQRIEYILKTGANWSGPIRDFRMVVDKGQADNLVSFCADGVKKIGPTQFEWRRSNYTPDGNFSVLILKRTRQ